MRKIGGIWIVLVLSLLAGACGGNGTAATGNGSEVGDAPEERYLLEIVADEFSFDLADSAPAGTVDVRLENVGKQPHHALIFRINDGVTYAAFKKAVLKDDSRFPALAERFGGIDKGVLSGVGEIDRSTEPYEPGIYAAVCFIRDTKTGKSHYELGMLTPFTVK